jgi:hypothetical protein
MPELIENGGKVELWAGWFLELPPAYYQRNDDGSWSAWGADWTVDVQIIEVSGNAVGKSASPEEMISESHEVSLCGSGWVGYVEQLEEVDGEQIVFRLAARLASENTLMSCWVSYFRVEQISFAREIINGVVHR